LTFKDAQINFNDYTICVILHAKIVYEQDETTTGSIPTERNITPELAQ